MKRNKRNSKPNRAVRNAVAHLNHLVQEIAMRKQVIADGGGTISAYVDKHGDAGTEFYGHDRRALRIVEREYLSLVNC